MILDQVGIKLEIKNRKTTGKFPNNWRLYSSILKDLWLKNKQQQQNKRTNKKNYQDKLYCGLDENEYTNTKILRCYEHSVRGKFIAQMWILGKRLYKINNIGYHFGKLKE